MNNSIKIISAVIAIILCVAGCAATPTEVSSSETNAASISSSDKAPGDGAPQKGAARETTTLAENQTQVMGKVTSIFGSELVLALGEMSKPEMSSDVSAASAEAPASEEAPASGETQADGRAPAGGQQPGGDKPEGNAPGGGMPGGGARGELTLTGESATYTVADDVAITKMGSSDAADISSVTADMTVRVIVETGDDGAQTVVQIEILSH